MTPPVEFPIGHRLDRLFCRSRTSRVVVILIAALLHVELDSPTRTAWSLVSGVRRIGLRGSPVLGRFANRPIRSQSVVDLMWEIDRKAIGALDGVSKPKARFSRETLMLVSMPPWDSMNTCIWIDDFQVQGDRLVISATYCVDRARGGGGHAVAEFWVAVPISVTGVRVDVRYDELRPDAGGLDRFYCFLRRAIATVKWGRR